MKLKADLLELENYIPWTAVCSSWGARRTAWARRTQECHDAQAVGKQLSALEAAIIEGAFEPEWRRAVSSEWRQELLEETNAERVRDLLREMEDHLLWLRFAKWPLLCDAFKGLLAPPLGSRLRECDAAMRSANTVGEQGLTIKHIQAKINTFQYSDVNGLAADLFTFVAASPSAASLESEIRAGLDLDPALPETEDEAEKTMEEETALSACSSPPGGHDEGPDAEFDLHEEVRLAGAKRSRVVEKEARFEQFKKQQRLHPEYAGIYADAFLSTPQEMKHFQELLVFKEEACQSGLMGVLQIEPHTTMRDLRQMLQDELGMLNDREEELVLSRSVYTAGTAAEHGQIGPTSRDQERHPVLPIVLTQNHKLVYPFFPLAAHVLIVDRPERLSGDAPRCLSTSTGGREDERLLCHDVSRGHERQPIPVYNRVDGEPSPGDFTYVTHCVVSEGLRLLLGGPMRDPWTCPMAGNNTAAGTNGLAYDSESRLIHPPHTVDSVYECSLLSMCNVDCRNRLVQLGPRYRLEVFGCGGGDGRFSKGWGVRSPDMVPRGSFVCEYIGEYISDDEAESRGIRYDQQKMSRLMDVVGDGKDVVRMCIDATKFSNLGRFLNHSCDPNCFKQRVFCDHKSRLPRIAFFALRDIPPYEELCYDYGYTDVPGKTMPCLCGAKGCKKLLY